MKSWQYRYFSAKVAQISRDEWPRLFITKGKQKNNFCTIRYLNGRGGKMAVQTDDGVELDIHYTDVEELDEYGQPQEQPVKDMTGREIVVDCHVAYSVASGHSSHALEIGKVVALTNVGGLKVRPLVHNGETITDTSWRRRESVVNDSMRSIRLPVDDTSMIMWIMQDFEVMAKPKD